RKASPWMRATIATPRRASGSGRARPSRHAMSSCWCPGSSGPTPKPAHPSQKPPEGWTRGLRRPSPIYVSENSRRASVTRTDVTAHIDQDRHMAPKVLIPDELSPTAVQIFKDRGIEVTFEPTLG